MCDHTHSYLHATGVSFILCVVCVDKVTLLNGLPGLLDYQHILQS